MNKKSVVITTGGTGGHIIPALVTAKSLIKDGIDIVFITDKRFHGFSSHFQDIIELNEFKLIVLDIKRVSGSFISKILTIVRLFGHFYHSLIMLKKIKPNLVVSFGNYVSLPVVLAAFFRKMPVLIHEQNAFLGRVNRLASIFAKKIMTSFTNTRGFYRFTLKKGVFTGMPIREDITNLHHKMENKNINYKAFYAIKRRLNIFVIGGSQGCSLFDKIVPEALKFFDENSLYSINIYHQCRNESVKSLTSRYDDLGISSNVSSFFINPGDIMSQAHIIIARSGAGTIFDIASTGAPSILCPLKIAKDNHQHINALEFIKEGAGMMLVEDNFTSKGLFELIKSLIENDDELFNISKRSRHFPGLDGNQKVVNVIKETLGVKLRLDAKEERSKNSSVGIG